MTRSHLEIARRNAEIVAAYLQGDPLPGIAGRYFISKQMVNKIIRRAGIPYRQPKKAAAKKKALCRS